ncbi:hypothetical protein DBR00_18130 [Pseudomonas sp. HMWF032]|uniref:outer membrane protein assembly factor BamE domain-containing protein n=1 Tax=unclassified Pseudomonas TaxID=196821 RepID=UPI000D3C2D45|nr:MULTISPECIES: outer membrane protein assembly factor BamE [unclassified Pseudomonas]PTS82038.1 hypothetical protein DBR00_18130 [Pseudomonas sp. HMWF032]PTT85760.1 hypothetical protein DBR41_02745 [Pseudomonas sp. HMWF010]WAC45781.1 outer membrane protein assembly factor BamE [Pseudomonas sp. SL4(2022)]
MPLRVVALLAGCLLLVACNKVNQDSYAQLKPGMSKDDVERLLGGPDECAGALGMSSCTWGDEQRFISVQYAGDKVMLFSGKGLK